MTIAILALVLIPTAIFTSPRKAWTALMVFLWILAMTVIGAVIGYCLGYVLHAGNIPGFAGDVAGMAVNLSTVVIPSVYTVMNLRQRDPRRRVALARKLW